MPRVEKLVPVDGRLGVVLDLPLEQLGHGSVSIYTEEEVEKLKASVRQLEREDILERIAARISQGKCPQCMAWECAKDIAATVSGKSNF